jgi:hypothetical protein
MATNNAAGPVMMEGSAVTLLNSYPDATATGIAAAVNTSIADFTFAAGTAVTPAVWTKVGAPGAGCTVSYTAAAVGAAPIVAVALSTAC